MADFDPNCHACPRLARYLAHVRLEHPDYYSRPVAPFGDPKARLLIIGLAPGMHGANRTGRPFTGDHAGILLYATLHRYGFANRPQSHAQGDGLVLKDCRITNAVKCLPPANRPTPSEIASCNPLLASELATLQRGSIVLALGAIAHGAVMQALGLRRAEYPFRHSARYRLSRGLHLFDSYHCSRYNTQTGRLTDRMFAAVIKKAATLLAE